MHVRCTWVLILPRVVCFVVMLYPARACRLAFESELGLYSTCQVRAVTAWIDCSTRTRYSNSIRSKYYNIGMREAFVQKAASFVSFRTSGSDPRNRPAGRRHGKSPPAGSCNFEICESAGQVRRSAETISRVMTRPDPRDFHLS